MRIKDDSGFRLVWLTLLASSTRTGTWEGTVVVACSVPRAVLALLCAVSLDPPNCSVSLPLSTVLWTRK